jgi:CSLREA domain-containing protein
VLCAAGTAVASPTFTVTSQTDAALATPSSALCETSAHTCTLRAAIQAADNRGGASTIALPAGYYRLTIASSGANEPSNGDLDIKGTGTAITLDGATAATTLIDANHIDRAFAVQHGASFTLAGVTIRSGASAASNGSSEGGYSTAHGRGGAIYNAGTLKVESSVLEENKAFEGGAVFSSPEATSTTVIGTTANYDTGSCYGGGIMVEGGTLTLTGDTLAHANGGCEGGAVFAGNYTTPATMGTVTISGCTFAADTGYYGGGIYLVKVAPSVTISSSIFTDDAANGFGGAIASIEGGLVSVSASTFSGSDSGAIGGGIGAKKGGLLTVRGSTFNGNVATSDGGALGLEANDLTVSESTFRDNDATYGGAILVDGSTATAAESITSSSFYANNATSTGGGAVYDEQGNLSLTSSTFSANTAAKYGGALYYTGGDGLTLTNDTLDSNLASDGGGGIYFQRAVSTGTAALLNDTIARNTATSGGGIYAPWYASTIQNTIVALNSGGDCYGAGYEDSADVGGNIDSDGTCFNSHVSGDQVHVNPLLGTLSNNGGTTETDALLSASPAIGHAVKSPTACPASDERGVSRPSACDSGAYQTPAAPVVVSPSPPSNSPAGSVSGSVSTASSTTTTTTTTGTSEACKSTRSETISWKVTKGVVLTRITVTLNGKLYRTLPASARTVKVSMVGLKKGTVTVLITGFSATDARYELTRTFHTCIVGPDTQAKAGAKPSGYLKATGRPANVVGSPAKTTGGSPA